MASKVGDLFAKIALKDEDFHAGLKRVRAGLVGLAALIGKGAGLAALGVAAVGATGQLLALAAALAPAASTMALLPALGLAAAFAMNTLKLGLAGVGDALKEGYGDGKKFEEALAKLSPQAQATVRALVGFKAQVAAIRTLVQDNLFSGLSTSVAALGKVYLPLASKALGDMAKNWNSAIKEAAGFAGAGGNIELVRQSLGFVNQAFRNLVPAVKPALEALLGLVRVGSGFLPGLAASVARLAQRFADFITHARETGQLQQWISSGLTVLRQLGQIVTNVTASFVALFSGATAAAGGGLLTSLVAITTSMREFMTSAEGAQIITTLFSTTGGVLSQLLPIVLGLAGAVAGPLVQGLMATTQALIPVAQQVAAALIPALQALLPQVPVLAGALGALVIACLPLVPTLTQIVVVIAQVLAAVTSWAAQTGLIAPIIGAVFTVIAVRATASAMRQVWAWTVTAAGAVKTAAVTTWAGIRIVAGWTMAAARAVASAAVQVAAGARVVASWVAQGAAATAGAARAAGAWALSMAGSVVAGAQMLAAGARVLAGWVMMAAGSVANAAIMAASWLIAFWPIALIIALVALIAVVVIKYWDEIKAWTISTFAGIAAAASAAWNFIWNAVKLYIGFVVAVIKTYIAIAVAIFDACWSAIKAVWSFLWSWVVAYVRTYIAVVVAVFNGLKTAAVAVWNGIKTAVSTAVSFIVAQITGWANMIRSLVTSAWNTAKSIFTSGVNAVASVASSLAGKVQSALSNVISTIRNVASSAMSTALTIGSSIIDGVVSGITGAASRAASAAANAVKGALDAAKNAIGVGSPAKAFIPVGKWSIVGYVKGWKDNLRKSLGAVGQFAKQFVPTVSANTPMPSATSGGPTTYDHSSHTEQTVINAMSMSDYELSQYERRRDVSTREGRPK